MSSPSSSSIPEFREWSIAAVRLFQGVIYSDEQRTWEILLRSRTALEQHFARLGLLLVVDEPEGYAFLRQWTEDEWPEGWDSLPKLMRKTPLGYGPTLLSVLLRDELRRFEEEDIHNERCVIEANVLFDQWKVFFPSQSDEVRQHREFMTSMRKLEELGFIKKFSDSPETWEIRRILKSRLPVTELERLKEQLVTAVARGGASPSQGETNG
jgi:hypothetical protein